MRLLFLFCLLAFSGLVNAQTENAENYLPPPDQVLRDYQGVNDLDTASRRYAALTLLMQATAIFSGTQAFRDMPPAIAARNRAYLKAQGEIQGPMERRFAADNCKGENCDRYRFYTATWRYELSTDFQKELAQRYFPPGLQSKFQDAKQRPPGSPRAPQPAPSAPTRTTVFIAVAVLLVLGVIGLIIQKIRYERRMGPIREKQRAWEAKQRAESLANADPVELANRALKRFGGTVQGRATAIDAAFDRKTADMTAFFYFKYRLNEPMLIDPRATINRSLTTMPVREREALRAAYHLFNIGQIKPELFYQLNVALVYGDGDCYLTDAHFYPSPPDITAMVQQHKEKEVLHINDATWNSLGIQGVIREYLAKLVHIPNTEAAVSRVMAALSDAIKTKPGDPVIKKLSARLYGGDRLAPVPEPSRKGKHSPLLIGTDEDTGKRVFYEGEGSLITIARPGAGKTRCHVMPNLLTWPAPAVVLDVKGELYASTSRWRQNNIGPVHKFSPLDDSGSQSYNPLSAVRPDVHYLWEDSRFLAEMMIVPSGAKDPFWDNKARDILTAAIALVCSNDNPARRTLSKVLDIIHGVNWQGFIAGLKERTDLDPMYRAGHSLDEELEPKVRSNVLQTAQASLSAWEGPRVTAATKTSDWQPLDLRDGSDPTVYICVRPNEIDSLLSVLRVLIAQHIRALISADPPAGSSPVLFVLDELPRLRRMAPVEEGLEIGRQYGIKLWLFAQSLGQLQNAYDNADGMIGNCGVRLYMNPSMGDGTAQRISEEIGYQDGLLDATRQKKVEPQVLAGPEYEDFVIVLEASRKPYRVRKYLIDHNAELKSRMGSL